MASARQGLVVKQPFNSAHFRSFLNGLVQFPTGLNTVRQEVGLKSSAVNQVSQWANRSGALNAKQCIAVLIVAEQVLAVVGVAR